MGHGCRFGPLRDRPTVTVLVGAGASTAAGAPTTAELLEPVLAAVPEELVEYQVGGQELSRAFPLAATIRESIGIVYGSEFQFEEVIAALEEMLAYDIQHGPIVSALLEPKQNKAILFEKRPLIEAYSSAIEAVVHYFQSKLRVQTEAQHEAKQSLGSFFRELASRYRVVLLSLNYDTFLDDVQ